MPDPASTKQTTADLVAELRAFVESVRCSQDLNYAFKSEMIWACKNTPYGLSSKGIALERFTTAADALKALAAENERLHDALDKVSLDWAQEMQARVSPPVSRIAAEAQELRDLRRENERLRGIEERLCNALIARTASENEEARLQYVLLKRIIHGDANA